MADRPQRPVNPGEAGRPRAAQRVRRCTLIQVVLLIATGLAAAVWTWVQLSRDTVVHDWIWLLVVATIGAWPTYAAWRSHVTISARIAEVEHQAAAAPTYESGYADGYLDALSGASTIPLQH